MRPRECTDQENPQGIRLRPGSDVRTAQVRAGDGDEVLVLSATVRISGVRGNQQFAGNLRANLHRQHRLSPGSLRPELAARKPPPRCMLIPSPRHFPRPLTLAFRSLWPESFLRSETPPRYVRPRPKPSSKDRHRWKFSAPARVPRRIFPRRCFQVSGWGPMLPLVPQRCKRL